jgi:hypothetical protein
VSSVLAVRTKRSAKEFALGHRGGIFTVSIDVGQAQAVSSIRRRSRSGACGRPQVDPVGDSRRPGSVPYPRHVRGVKGCGQGVRADRQPEFIGCQAALREGHVLDLASLASLSDWDFFQVRSAAATDRPHAAAAGWRCSPGPTHLRTLSSGGGLLLLAAAAGRVHAGGCGGGVGQDVGGEVGQHDLAGHLAQAQVVVAGVAA